MSVFARLNPQFWTPFQAPFLTHVTVTTTITRPPPKGLVVLAVSGQPGHSPLARRLLTPGLARSLAPAPSISLITAMKAVQAGASIRPIRAAQDGS